MNTTEQTSKNKTAVLRVRVRPSTKRTIEDAAQRLETDQSTLVRWAIREYLRQHLHDAA